MRIGIISDTHGDEDAIKRAARKVPNADLWLHAGDCSQDAGLLADLVTVPVIAARGNCDGHVAARIDEFVEVTGHKIWLTHGHHYSVKSGQWDLVRLAADHGVDIVIYGHTHIHDNRVQEGILLFNPGSAYGKRGTCGILDIDSRGCVIGSLIELNG